MYVLVTTQRCGYTDSVLGDFDHILLYSCAVSLSLQPRPPFLFPIFSVTGFFVITRHGNIRGFVITPLIKKRLIQRENWQFS